ncbi:MAG: hypothetical protein KBA91_02640 [Candidatus Moranbacteria bacterium]|jgi:hypothetical protein|nr:hypothetical protein [Candidatus Moranbacteria bacterium]
MEHQDPMFEEETSANQAKEWVQENLRILVSVFIVAAIAFGIYSYSQRTQTVADDGSMLLDTKGDTTTDTAQADSSASSMTTKTPTTTGTKSDVVVTPELSHETEASFVEQAERGNGTTHLARRALAHYLEKNTDSALTAEHKIYIEDYLRKNVSHQGTLLTGASVEFSKTLISQAIEKSKTLNERQLQNLKKYSARVSAYR